MCVNMCVEMRVDVCVDMCIDMCMDMCTVVCVSKCGHVYKGVYRHAMAGLGTCCDRLFRGVARPPPQRVYRHVYKHKRDAA